MEGRNYDFRGAMEGLERREWISRKGRRVVNRLEQSRYLAEQKLWRLEELGQTEYIQEG